MPRQGDSPDNRLQQALDELAAGGETPLPASLPPTFPLYHAAKQSLSELANNNETILEIEKHLEASVLLLADNVYAINHALDRKRQTLRKLARKRRRENTDKTKRDIAVENALARLEGKVPDLTRTLEAAIRQMIDDQVGLQDEKTAISDAVASIPDRPDPPGAATDGDDDVTMDDAVEPEQEQGQQDQDRELEEEEELEPGPVILDLIKTTRAEQTQKYAKLSAYERYSVDNRYIRFKNMWHEAQHPLDDVPVPDASTWFDREGNPVMDANQDRAADADQDIVIAREKRKLECPLSLRPLQEPYTNRTCKHTYEKSAIMEYIAHGPQKCPVCNTMVNKNNLFLDEAIVRKLQREEEARRRGDDASSDVDEDNEESVRTASSTSGAVKREPGIPERSGASQ